MTQLTNDQLVERDSIREDLTTFGVVRDVCVGDIDALTLRRISDELEYGNLDAGSDAGDKIAMLINWADDEDEFLNAVATALVLE